jgi:hypothetical protein
MSDDLAAKLRERMGECDDLRELNNDLIRTHDWLEALLDGVALTLKGKPPANGMLAGTICPNSHRHWSASSSHRKRADVRPDSPRCNSRPTQAFLYKAFFGDNGCYHRRLFAPDTGCSPLRPADGVPSLPGCRPAMSRGPCR